MLPAAPVFGAIVTLNVSGFIDSIGGPGGPGLAAEFSLGEPLSGTFSYNTSAVDVNSNPDLGEYPLSFNSSLMFGDYSVTAVVGLVTTHR